MVGGTDSDWKICIEFGSQRTAETWRRWVESWYLAYALLGASAAGLVPMLLPLAVHHSRGVAYVGWVIALGLLLALTVRPVRRSHLDPCPGK